ncbi:histidinol-phosphatase HisJ family protein [Anaerosacchariphilus polymeriproducens]|uniref:Histidinol-phosphatase n=1 Tax=Anaerosacchariphilus polymeriproducens TaxID=1812858 RepID=A0A371AXI7_9FIRM|nr:histidinol-phosphatase HisJ family protein [Anaerosacchariphilus polymeriproducens]RDU24274.1 PHP domain-containing protein [Anaerosacchariphilus polymeriproducens]
MICDLHLHSNFSGDSNTPMELIVKQAIFLGIDIICFTDHQDTDNPYDGELFEIDFELYFKEFETLKKLYSDRIELLIGMELGLQTRLAKRHSDMLKKYPFDFVIGSNHLINGLDPYFPEYFQTRKESAGYQEYFESILSNINAFSEFDVFGHLDYVIRYGPNKNKFYSYKKYADIIDEILKTLIQKQVGLELNTGGFKYGLGHPNPHEDILKRYKELGGEIITIGSDAHTIEYIGHEFNRAISILKQCGFKHYNIFKNREPEYILI